METVKKEEQLLQEPSDNNNKRQLPLEGVEVAWVIVSVCSLDTEISLEDKDIYIRLSWRFNALWPASQSMFHMGLLHEE